MLIKPDVQRFAKIKILGLGGGGGNAVSSMINTGQIQGVEFVAVNTDAQALLTNPSPTKVQIGEALTRGLGAGGNPDIGRQAAEESTQKLEDVLSGSDMVFLTAGMGGGTGSGSILVAATVAKKLGALTVAVVTKPFQFEGSRRMMIAEEAVEELKDKVDALIVIPNQRLLEVVDKNMTLSEAFRLADSVLGQGVQGISDLITSPGLINVDFADVRTIMTNAGSALMGIGQATGDNRAELAARQAIASQLLEVSIEGAKGVLFNIVGGPDLGMDEVDKAAKVISAAADPDANIIFGTTIKDDMVDQIKISVIATGFDQTRAKFREFVGSGLPQMGMPQPMAGSPYAQPQAAQNFEDNTSNMQADSSTIEDESPSIPDTPQVEEDSDKWEIPAFLRRNN
jgi:cell division protein FtsZ